MRPAVGGDALQQHMRKHSFADPEGPTASVALGNSPPSSFFIAKENELHDPNESTTSTAGHGYFGVQSLNDAVEQAGASNEGEESKEVIDDGNEHGNRRRSTLKPLHRESRDHSSDSLGQAPASSDGGIPRRPSPGNISQPQTPVSYCSPALESSLPSSPKSTSSRSLRHSDEESMDGGSQAIVSSGEEEGNDEEAVGAPSIAQLDTPQLIMPSIKMPSRRPFTERGKNMGKLKVLIAGDTGVGKTSLIKSIVQTCEDIVHVDPLSSSSAISDSAQSRRPKSPSNSAYLNATKEVTEVYASTRAYPSWWSDFEENRVLRRRKSTGDTVLERNLCFVDTPGYSRGMSTSEGIESVIHYMESQMARSISLADLNDGDLLSVLGGGGGFQVDVAFYLISKHLKPTDQEFLNRLNQLTNVIPVLAQADLYNPNEIRDMKTSISNEIKAIGLKHFSFYSRDQITSLPYTVCSTSSNDEDNMDASLLMSPDYVQPLLPSELALLVDQVFEQESVSWLRHSAAKKLISWQRFSDFASANPLPRLLSPLEHNIDTSSSFTSSFTLLNSPKTHNPLASFARRPSSYAQARIADHTQREEKLAQVHLAKWAGDLQRSLQNERARFQKLARGERTSWLTDRLNECANDGTLAVDCQNNKTLVSVTSGINQQSSSAFFRPRTEPFDSADPLGILEWNEKIKQRGWVTFQVVGSFGVLGALFMWGARHWGIGGESFVDWKWGTEG